MTLRVRYQNRLSPTPVALAVQGTNGQDGLLFMTWQVLDDQGSKKAKDTGRETDGKNPISVE